MKHLAPLTLFAALTIGWTWPLASHLTSTLPGGPGDNYSFVWNLWWMRHVLATPGLAYFHTNFLFYPFGTTIADHPHTALPALIAATLLGGTSVITAQNLLLLGYVFANMAVMYALAWDITRHRRASVLAAVIFGLSPYLAVHLLGHFDLVSAWVLPAFALAMRRAVRGSNGAALGAGLVLAATAYIAYYYVVYEGYFAAIYLAGGAGTLTLARARQPQRPAARTLRVLCSGGAIAFGAAAAAIMLSGGRTFRLGGFELAARTPQNALTAMWICLAGWLVCGWRPRIVPETDARERIIRAVAVAWRVGAVFVVGSAPLLWQAAQLMAHGEYVTQQYGWRSAPRGVDLIAPILGHPLQPLMAAMSRPAYAATGQDYIEGIAWLGITPIVLLIAARKTRPAYAGIDVRVWWTVAVAFAIFALGPFLTIDGFDTGLKLPEILMRYIPLAANARMPGRAMVGVYMALAVLIAMSVSASTGRLRSTAIQWLLIGLVVFEYWDAPTLFTPLDRPAVYQTLAAAPPGAVCEVPMGIGDGLSTGVGSQERSALYYATVHEHPLVGGYIGRMPADAAVRYEQMPVAGPLLLLSDGRPDAATAVHSGESPCRYFVVHRNALSPALRAYVEQLPLDRIGTDSERDLYQLRLR